MNGALRQRVYTDEEEASPEEKVVKLKVVSLVRFEDYYALRLYSLRYYLLDE